MRNYQRNGNLAPARIRRGRAVLVGYGLDDADGHVRYSRGQATELYGGSERAHQEMQERAQRIHEEIARLGISLEHMTYEQFLQVREIVDRVNCE